MSLLYRKRNVERYISRCVESILHQTFTDYELILVDDGSPDDSSEICEKYAINDSRIVVVHKENGGLSSARNAGIDVAQGEYLFFIDGDDVIHPETLETLYSDLISGCTQIAAGNFCRFHDMEPVFQPNKEVSSDIYSGIQVLEKLYDKDNASRYVSVCGKLIQRSLFEGIRFPVGRLFEDEFTTYLLYYKADKISITEHILYYYYVNDNGITRNLTLQQYFDEYDAQWQRILFYKDRKLEEIYHKALLCFLDSGRWTIISCQKRKETFDEKKAQILKKRYRAALRWAEEEKILNFLENYDYYVLGRPEFVLYYRIKRIIMKYMKKDANAVQR